MPIGVATLNITLKRIILGPMPYSWSENPRPTAETVLRLWPHNSLPRKGFAAFILATFLLISMPLFGLLGTVLLWGLLPFGMLALAGLWYALRRNEADREILETLTIGADSIHLVRTNPRGAEQEWQCNPYWAKLTMHPQNGPVPHYITLSGAGREVEIGAFLSENERMALYSELTDRMRRITSFQKD
ncbi:Uncharacterized membrane protein [Primorskyibacter flagellatus]|uniref:Uncharacterized membrane protein n=2 Tax=Primorskyibacter flagellatus TaxID=1387277 RepID=A0A1W2BGA5_9RHOB|nr:Uncharacterized membrane protein [Primorskyibacter flagellatus]